MFIIKDTIAALSTLLLLPAFTAHSQPVQRFHVFNYSVNEGMLQSSVADMAVDNLNYVWLSYPNGIQKFDGIHFSQVSIQPGLPDDRSVNFFTASDGTLFIAHKKGVSVYDSPANTFKQLYYTNDETLFFFVGEYQQQLFFVEQGGTLKKIDLQSKQLMPAVKPIPALGSVNVIPLTDASRAGQKYAATLHAGYIYILSFEKEAVIDSVPYSFGSRIKDFLIQDEELLYYAQDQAGSYIVSWYIPTRKKTVKPRDFPGPLAHIPAYMYKTAGTTMLALADRVFKTSSTYTELLAELVNFQNLPIGNKGAIKKIIADRFGNYYFLTVRDGLYKLMGNTYPIQYYGLSGNRPVYALYIWPDKSRNRIFIGTSGNGLLVYDTSQKLLKQITWLPGMNTTPDVNMVLPLHNGGYLFTTFGSECFWQLSKDLNQLSKTPVVSQPSSIPASFGYYACIIYRDPYKAILVSDGFVYKVNLVQPAVETFHIFNNASFYSGGFLNGDIVVHRNDHLYFIDTAAVKIKSEMPLLNTAGVRSFARASDGGLWIGTNRGIFKMSAGKRITAHYDKSTGLPDECIYAMTEDENGHLWCSTNKGLVRLDGNGRVFQLTKEDGLQENEFNSNAVAVSDDQEIFFGGVRGVNSFYPGSMDNLKDSLHLRITSLKVNNNNPYPDIHPDNISRLTLSPGDNNLNFEFLAMGSSNPSQYIYQYRMKGVDEEWIENKGLQPVRYHLAPGKYTLQLYASKSFVPDAKPLKEIAVFIRPPFYKTGWFLSILGVTTSCLIFFVVNGYNKRKYRRRLWMLESERKLQSERERISRDLHDDIGAYANAVLYQAELLDNHNDSEQKKRLITDLKFASKDIITALREAVWALKKDSYQAGECLLRLRNFFQNCSRYYPGIECKVEGKAPENKLLDHIAALNLVRIVQEAVTNSIKHAGATTIRLVSEVTESGWVLFVSDNGKGFDVSANQAGSGLINMEQRAVEAGLQYHFVSGSSGTTISLVIR